MTVAATITIRARVLLAPRWWLPLCVMLTECVGLSVAYPVVTGVRRDHDGIAIEVEVCDVVVPLPSRVMARLLGKPR